MKIADFIKMERNKQGLTLRDLAKKIAAALESVLAPLTSSDAPISSSSVSGEELHPERERASVTRLGAS